LIDSLQEHLDGLRIRRRGALLTAGQAGGHQKPGKEDYSTQGCRKLAPAPVDDGSCGTVRSSHYTLLGLNRVEGIFANRRLRRRIGLLLYR
jgi:hypothetical protein